MADPGAGIEEVVGVMETLGQAWRGDWSDFDGRTLRSQLEEVGDLMRRASMGESVTNGIARFYASWGICSQCRSWSDHCLGHADV